MVCFSLVYVLKNANDVFINFIFKRFVHYFGPPQ